MRPVRRPGHDARGRPARQARPHLPQARPARATRRCACSTSAAGGARWPLHAAGHYGARVGGVDPQPRAGRPGPGTGPGRRARANASRSASRTTGTCAASSFDAISSIGMFEHVGAERMDEYFATLCSLLAPTGRLLNHAISKPGRVADAAAGPSSNRYVFPDGELIDVAEVVRAMERAGFEVRDVESLREHYPLTLQAWVANLETRPGTRRSRMVGQGPRRRLAALHGRVGQRFRRRRSRRAPGPRRRPGPQGRAGCRGHGQAGAEPCGR